MFTSILAVGFLLFDSEHFVDGLTENVDIIIDQAFLIFGIFGFDDADERQISICWLALQADGLHTR